MSWSELQLGEALHVKHGFTFKGEFFAREGNLMVVTPGNFLESGGFRVRAGKERFYTSDFPESYLLAKDDLIVAMTEQGEGLLGSAARIPEGDRYLHNQRIGLVAVTDVDRLDKGFLYWLLNSQPVRAQIRGSSTGTKVRHTAPERIYKVRVTIPDDVCDQAKIAETLDRYNSLIETSHRRIELLEESARLLYQEWFINFRFPNHQTVKNCGDLPQGWSVVTLGDLAFLNYGKALKDTDRRSGDIPVYGSSGVVGFHDQALVSGPGIIVGRKGNVGSVYFSECDFSPIDTVFYISTEQSSYFVHQLLKTMSFISSDSAVPGLNRNYAHGVQVLKPEESVLIQFEQLVDPIYKQIETLLRTNKNAAEARDALLPKLMSGAIQV